ncbi:restriction endonuclease subunit S [Prevotella communis]|uniref:restriction endonuclease subunit S n=1 Tax=Prevotella communis TaxID=2913614 RepID=UPI001EDA9E3A|nr:restriction endonuclease subunit S [Prevotella communis]UKK61696.1 restriction endonuclease subunit S [Prevotella communis]UKK64522.1 restriction endonuclease subunit S [Prevotella communis]
MREGWTYKKLGEVCESDLGKTLNSSKDTGEMRPYLCAINILWDKIDFTTLKQTRFEESELERYTVRKGDLLICEGGEIGRAAIWDKDYSIQYQNALHRVRFTDGVAARFCLYFFMHLKKSGILDGRYGKGVTIKHLVKSSLMSIPIPVAPIENQLSIVAELDKINELISLKKAQLSDLDSLAQSIFYDMFGDPIENEKGWEVKKLGEISSVKTGPFGSMLHKEDYISNGIPLVNPIHIKDYRVIADMDFTISDEKARELNAYILRKNDVIFARRGDIGRCAVISDKENGYLCGTGSLFVRFEQEVIPQYIMYIIRSSSFIKELISKAKGATMLNLNSTTIASLGIPLPPLSLQQEFAKRIELIEQQKAQVSSTIKDLETLLASRMQYWFD